MRGRGTAPRWMRCQPKRRTLRFPVHRFGQWSHRKPNPCASRGAGEYPLPVGSLCPRRKLCGGVPPVVGTPPTHPTRRPAPISRAAMGFAPPACAKRSIRPRSSFSATLRRPLYSRCHTIFYFSIKPPSLLGNSYFSREFYGKVNIFQGSFW